MEYEKQTVCIAKKQKPSDLFRNVMKSHTADIISELSSDTYSWGYNYCIHYSPDPRGWSPDVFFVSDYDDVNRKSKNVEDPGLPGYSRVAFEEYCNTQPKVKAILQKNEDRDRFAVQHIIPNLNRTSPRVDVKLKKTSWVQLQYSWDYFRLLNVKNNQPIEEKVNCKWIREALHKPFMMQGKELYINSFCLHLLIETKNGVILSRIAQAKENDYASTWAATIGEQIEESDFRVVGNNASENRNNFVEWWVKRALEEEFGIDRELEYEDIVEPSSLKVLSVDMEADIYNVALTCVIQLKNSYEDFISDHRMSIDHLENFE